MTKEEIKRELHVIGFTDFEHLRKTQRDGKKRFTWTRPLTNFNNWFTVLLVEEDEQLYIERLENPLGITFERSNVAGLLRYIKENVLHKLAKTDT
jgi:hypothetical protein